MKKSKTDLFQEKILRFEKSLAFHNRSPKLAEFWNEISEDLIFYDETINEFLTENYFLFKKFGELQQKIQFLETKNLVLSSAKTAYNFLLFLKSQKTNSIPYFYKQPFFDNSNISKSVKVQFINEIIFNNTSK